MKKFVFECYDCFNNNDMITEQNLFCFMHLFEKYFDNYETTIRRKLGKTEPNKDPSIIVYKQEEDYELRDLELNKKNPKLLKINQTEQDTFLNIFGDEFVKIASALHAKRLKN